jgi:uncharacterized protein with HEPN domain
MNANQIYVHHMIDATDEIQKFLDGLSYLDFINDPVRMHAIVRLFEILGEAAGKLSDEFKAKNPNIPYADIIGMRNKLIHHYMEVDFEILWKVYEEDLEDLKKALQSALSS